nr:heavy metal-associated isoprenylated plant protein 4 [Tanacetum cinerariifolium]
MDKFDMEDMDIYCSMPQRMNFKVWKRFYDLRAKLLKHKGIHNVKTNIKSQIVLIEGTIESEKIVTYMHKIAHKPAVEFEEKIKVEAKAAQHPTKLTTCKNSARFEVEFEPMKFAENKRVSWLWL